MKSIFFWQRENTIKWALLTNIVFPGFQLIHSIKPIIAVVGTGWSVFAMVLLLNSKGCINSYMF